jgi:hypothetical protein
MLHFGYFVLRHDGQLFPAGDDWGPTVEMRKPGVSLGVKNGTEGIVAGTVTGAGAMRKGFDVLVIVDQQPAAGPRNPLPTALAQAVIIALETPPCGGPPTIQALWNGQRFVAIWNKLIIRPATETFHEFLIEVPLKGTFGETWYQGEMAKATEAERHIVVRWLKAFREQQAKHLPTLVRRPPGKSRSSSPWLTICIFCKRSTACRIAESGPSQNANAHDPVD